MSEKRPRLIFHCDGNNFFASCECLDHPELKNVPMAVAGNPENRTGIVVAKNELAQKCGVKTTDTVWAAKKKCPGIVFMPPRHKLYEEISARVNKIYLEYTDFVEPASIDESYLDLTGAPEYYGVTPRDLADILPRKTTETFYGICRFVMLFVKATPTHPVRHFCKYYPAHAIYTAARGQGQQKANRGYRLPALGESIRFP